LTSVGTFEATNLQLLRRTVTSQLLTFKIDDDEYIHMFLKRSSFFSSNLLADWHHSSASYSSLTSSLMNQVVVRNSPSTFYTSLSLVIKLFQSI